jgi:hypothetical protein
MLWQVIQRTLALPTGWREELTPPQQQRIERRAERAYQGGATNLELIALLERKAAAVRGRPTDGDSSDDGEEADAGLWAEYRDDDDDDDDDELRTTSSSAEAR